MINILAFSFLIAVVSFLLTGLTLNILKNRNILDRPNERSSHSTPVPRGGGIPIVVLSIFLWLIYSFKQLDFSSATFPPIIYLLIGCILIAVVSWVDDITTTSPAHRFIVQCLALALGIASLPPESYLFQGLLPGWLDTAIIYILWLWFVNLFNFMDGIDCLTGVEATTICGGLILISTFYVLPEPDPWYPAILGSSIIGFLWWNLPPAKIFLGDIGSITIGYMLGWLLVSLALSGYWASAVILPLYYLTDATITLLKRATKKEKIWLPHKQHYYQKAVQSGKNHSQVSASVGLANIGLIGLSLLAISYPLSSLIASVVIVFLLISWMNR